MAKTYLIDGYNLLLRWRRGGIRRGPATLSHARNAFIAMVARRLPDGDAATIVFDSGGQRSLAVRRTTSTKKPTHVQMPDSAREEQSLPTANPRVRVIYAHGHSSADDWIMDECDRRRPARDLVVVTNDRMIQHAATRAQATVCTSDQFLLLITDSTPEEASGERSANRGKEPPPETEKPPLLDEVLHEFREAMQDGGSIADSEAPSAPKESPKKQPPNDVPRRDIGDLSDFYREMKDWEEQD